MYRKLLIAILMFGLVFSITACNDDSAYEDDVRVGETEMTEDDIQYLVAQALYIEIKNTYTGADVGSTKYKINSEESNGLGETTVYGKVYLYDKYGNFYSDSISMDFRVVIDEDEREIKACSIH